MGCLPVVQDHFGPDYRDVSGMLRAKITECDALIHIAGMRYGAERRSYTQMEVDLARELKLEKIFTFVCPAEFPYDTTDTKGEPLSDKPEALQALQALQIVHRERLLQQKELRYRSNTPEELASQVREIQLELQAVRGELAGTRAKIVKVGSAIVVALVLIGGLLFGLCQGQDDVEDDVGEVAENVADVGADFEARLRQFENNPGLIAEQLKAFIRRQAASELEQAKAKGDWESLAQLEAARDRQIDDVDNLIETIRSGLAVNADPVIVNAAEILGNPDPETGGPENALRYLEVSKSRLLSEVDQLSADEAQARDQKRERLRAILLEAEIHVKAFEWEEALEDLRLVVKKAPTWWEAINYLGDLCSRRAIWDEADRNLRLGLLLL